VIRTFEYDRMPIVEVVNEIIVDAAKRKASDIHFDPHENILKVRIRIDGILNDYTEVPLTLAKNMITRVKIIAGMNITENRLPQDGAIKTTIHDMDLDMRVSCLPTNQGEKIVIRILDYTMSLSGIENLGFNESNLEKALKMIAHPNGIILITGATGSGKSTTLYTFLKRLNKPETNIITVEDPVEMNIEGVNQVQTQSEIGLDFSATLRSILRQDPDIVMIGEIRDTETAKIAVRASITGHLVLSTVHTNNSLNTIERLVDMEVERYLLASSLVGIISQKLARKLCDNCKKLRPTTDYEKKFFKKILGKDVNEIYDTVGCDKCHAGFAGRIAIHEVLLINQDIKDAIAGGLRKEQLRKLVYNDDVITLLEDGLMKAIEGITTFEEILKIIELEDDDYTEDDNYDLKSAIDYSALKSKKLSMANSVLPTTSINNGGVKEVIPVTPIIGQPVVAAPQQVVQEPINVVPQQPVIAPQQVVQEPINTIPQQQVATPQQVVQEPVNAAPQQVAVPQQVAQEPVNVAPQQVVQEPINTSQQTIQKPTPVQQQESVIEEFI